MPLCIRASQAVELQSIFKPQLQIARAYASAAHFPAMRRGRKVFILAVKRRLNH
jgi:hypothetical protein